MDLDPIVFPRASCDLAYLHRLVLALLGGACGLRLLDLFLRLRQLDRPMIYTDLIDYVAAKACAGQHQLATNMKTLLADLDHPICALLDYGDDWAFLEPSLFAHLSGSAARATLEQLLYGYIEDGLKPDATRVIAGKDGIIYLPRVGYFATNLSNREVTLSRTRRPESFSLMDETGSIAYRFERLTYAAGSHIEVSKYNDSITEQFFRSLDGTSVDVAIRGQVNDLGSVLNAALELLREVIPELGTIITSVTRRIVLFREERLNSFASPAIHGVAFLNTVEGATKVFFVEDIAHQCGHIIFTAMTSDSHEYLTVNPDTNLGLFTGETDESRNLHVVLHGIFTECLIAICLYRFYARGIFRGPEAHELLGRLAFILLRSHFDMQSLCYEKLFTEKGLWLVREIAKVLNDVYCRIAGEITGLDFSNQSYNFNYGKFCHRNPMS